MSNLSMYITLTMAVLVSWFAQLIGRSSSTFHNTSPLFWELPFEPQAKTIYLFIIPLLLTLGRFVLFVSLFALIRA